MPLILSLRFTDFDFSKANLDRLTPIKINQISFGHSLCLYLVTRAIRILKFDLETKLWPSEVGQDKRKSENKRQYYSYYMFYLYSVTRSQ